MENENQDGFKVVAVAEAVDENGAYQLGVTDLTPGENDDDKKRYAFFVMFPFLDAEGNQIQRNIKGIDYDSAYDMMIDFSAQIMQGGIDAPSQFLAKEVEEKNVKSN